MKQTNNYGFKKYEGTDNVGVTANNDNFDILDEKMKEIENNALCKKRIAKFTESDTFTVPEGVKYIDVFLLNGGQGGNGGSYIDSDTGSSNNDKASAMPSYGGYGGNHCYHYGICVENADAVSIVVGEGGTGEAPRKLQYNNGVQIHSDSYGGESYVIVSKDSNNIKYGCSIKEPFYRVGGATSDYKIYPDDESMGSPHKMFYGSESYIETLHDYLYGCVCTFDGKLYGGAGGKGDYARFDSDKRQNEIISEGKNGYTANSGDGGNLANVNERAGVGQNALPNTGAGGGGGASTFSNISNAAYGGNGGSGIVIILY